MYWIDFLELLDTLLTYFSLNIYNVLLLYDSRPCKPMNPKLQFCWLNVKSWIFLYSEKETFWCTDVIE